MDSCLATAADESYHDGFEAILNDMVAESRRSRQSSYPKQSYSVLVLLAILFGFMARGVPLLSPEGGRPQRELFDRVIVGFVGVHQRNRQS